MVMELWKNVESMDSTDIKLMIGELKKKDSRMSLEERFKLYFGLLKLDYLDNAMFQMQLIYNEIKDKGLNNEFVVAHPDLKISLMSTFHIWEDGCGNIHIEEICCCGPDCDDCVACGAILLSCACLSACCPGLFDYDTGFCCNSNEGGCCCNNCCTDCCYDVICEGGCGC